jgi:hypothetical protein
MAENQNVNKVIYGGQVLIDLTADTITAGDLAAGVTAHDKSGALITGTDTRDSDTSKDTAAVAEILAGKTAHARGAQLVGTMKNNGGAGVTVSSKSGSTIPQGYYDGSGKATIDAASATALVAGNVKQGVSILGVTGTYAGEAAKLQTKSVTPSTKAQTITADTGYDALSSVTVAAIPYSEADNSAGGKTVTIAG